MNNKRRMWFIIIIIIVILCIGIVFIGYYFQAATPSGASIEKPRMARCASASNACTATGATQFSSQDRICAVWTTVNKDSADSISLFVYKGQNPRLFTYTEPKSTSTVSRQCRSVEINNLTGAGTYRTEFSINGRPFGTKLEWTITP